MVNKKGWVISNNETGDTVIQKDDDIDRFKSDDEATEFVVKSYNEFLKVCKEVYNLTSGKMTSEQNRRCQQILKQVIDKTEG